LLRYRDGHAAHCTLEGDFTPRDTEIRVVTEDGLHEAISVLGLKAVFFLKDPRRRTLELESGVHEDPTHGMALARVEFFDGEIIRGRVEGYSVDNSGFFLYPTTADSNNERVFVVARALQTVAIEG
jgi:hypothetical protein